MALRLSTGLRNAMLGTNSFKTVMQNGVIRVFSGVQPTSADDARPPPSCSKSPGFGTFTAGTATTALNSSPQRRSPGQSLPKYGPLCHRVRHGRLVPSRQRHGHRIHHQRRPVDGRSTSAPSSTYFHGHHPPAPPPHRPAHRDHACFLAAAVGEGGRGVSPALIQPIAGPAARMETQGEVLSAIYPSPCSAASKASRPLRGHLRSGIFRGQGHALFLRLRLFLSGHRKGRFHGSLVPASPAHPEIIHSTPATTPPSISRWPTTATVALPRACGHALTR